MLQICHHDVFSCSKKILDAAGTSAGSENVISAKRINSKKKLSAAEQ